MRRVIEIRAKSHLIQKVVTKYQNDAIPLGFDYVLTKEGRPYLLEINMDPGGLYSSIGGAKGQSVVNVFISNCLNKGHQHQIFGELMPRFTTDREKFDAFIKERDGRVVYKKVKGAHGEGVSIIKKPKWEPELIEEFIEPKTIKVEGKHYPIVIRELVYLGVENESLEWGISSTFRKKGRESLEDQVNPNTLFRLNIGPGRAEREAASKEEIEATNEMTVTIMEKLIGAGINSSWNATKIFKEALLLYHLGFRTPIFAQIPDYLLKVKECLKNSGIKLDMEPADGRLKKRMKNLSYGYDMIVLNPFHSERDWSFGTPGPWIRYTVRRGKNNNITVQYQDSQQIVEEIDHFNNVLIENEVPVKQLVERIFKYYQQNRAKEGV